MGIEHRDYYRDGSYSDRIGGLGLEITPMVKWLILVNAAVFVFQVVFTKPENREMPDYIRKATEKQFEMIRESLKRAKERVEKTEKEIAELKEGSTEKKEKLRELKAREETVRRLEESIISMEDNLENTDLWSEQRISVVQQWLELEPNKTVYKGQLWRMIGSAFCHDRMSPWHLVMNMVLLYWFGKRLESMYGSREFLLFYLAAAISSSAAFVSLALYTGSNTPAIGASGAVMGVMFLYTIFYPNETFLLFWILPVPLWVLLGVYVIYDVHPVLLALSGQPVFTGVAHAGHLGGLVFGFLYWKFGLRLEAPLERQGKPSRFLPRKAKARTRDLQSNEPKILSMGSRRATSSDEVDEILKKISEQGQASLTEEERATLLRASEKYRGEK